MFFLTFIATTFAGEWHVVGDSSALSAFADINNGQTACIQVSANTCNAFSQSVADSIYMPLLGFSAGACDSDYRVTCSQFPDTTYDLTYTLPIVGSASCGQVSLIVRTKTNVDCELAIPDADLPDGAGPARIYSFTSGSFYQSTGITDACIQGLLPSTCGGVDMEAGYLSMGGVASSCTYSYACNSINSQSYTNFGPCGTASFDVYTQNADGCTAAASAAAAAMSSAETTNCVDADSVLDAGLTCQDAYDNIGCNPVIAAACPSLCNPEVCGGNTANKLTLGLGLLTATLFAL